MSQAFAFDKSIPIPTTTVRQGVNITLLKAMSPGDSKWWPVADQKKATRFYRVAKRLGVPIVIRKVDENDPKGAGVRMWRVDGEGKGADPIAAAAAAAAPKTRKAPAKKAAKVAKKKAPKTTKKPAKKTAKGSRSKHPLRRATDRLEADFPSA